MRISSWLVIILFFTSGFPKTVHARSGKLLSFFLPGFGERIPSSVNRILKSMKIDPNSLPEETLRILENTWDNPLKLITDYGLSLDDILDSDIYTVFFFSRLDLSNINQTPWLFHHLIPNIDIPWNTIHDKSIGSLKSSSEFWNEFTETIDEVRIAGYSEITKADIESAFITYLGDFSYFILPSNRGSQFIRIGTSFDDSWVEDILHANGVFFGFATGSGTKIHEILTNPHFKPSFSGGSLQKLMKFVLSHPSKIDEVLGSKEAVLKVWSFIKDTPLTGDTQLRRVNRNTFKKYVIRHLKRDGTPENGESIETAINGSPFLLAVFEAAREDTKLAEMLEDVLVSNIMGISDKEFLRKQMAWVLFGNRTPEERERIIEGSSVSSILHRVITGENRHYIEGVEDFVPLSNQMR